MSVASAFSAQAVTTADILFVVDESGSMSGEHAWIANMVTALESELGAAGVTGNRYGLVGFGATSHSGTSFPDQEAHKHAVGGGDFGSAAQLSTAATGLNTTGGFEDGWQAIDFALNNYSFRGDAALNVILITDEDRDTQSGTPGFGMTYADVLSELVSRNALLNAVVNANLRTDTAAVAVGHDSEGNAYRADGSGGYTTSATGSATGAGTTIADYYNLALDTGGAAWDLNQLRAGGNTAVSFTAAFVDIKVQEIITQPPSEPPSGVPDGGATVLLLAGALGMIVTIRRRILA